MFAYNPLVQNRSGEITGQGQIQGAQNIAAGINSASSGIAGGLTELNKTYQTAKQGDTALDLGKTLGLFDDENGDFNEEAFNTLKALPWQQKAGLAPTMIGLINASTMRNYRSTMAGIQSQNAATRAANSEGHYGLLPN